MKKKTKASPSSISETEMKSDSKKLSNAPASCHLNTNIETEDTTSDKYPNDTDIENDNDFLLNDSKSDASGKKCPPKSNAKLRNRQSKNSNFDCAPKSNDLQQHTSHPQINMMSFKTRTLWTIILISCFILIILAGHVYCSLLVCGLIIAAYHEIISLRRKLEDHLKLPQYFFLRWYWFVVTVSALGFPWLVRRYPRFDKIGTTLLNYHSLCIYLYAFFGLVWFILSLRQYTLRYQFSQLAIMLFTLLYVVLQSLMYIENIYHGMIWFILPSSLVIINDVSAYLFGIFFGKTQLIKLSPRKTVEGYIGASIVTILSSVLLTCFLQQYNVMICPQQQINFTPFSMWWETDCIPKKSFIPITFELPRILKAISGKSSIIMAPIVLHSLPIGIFAAFFAPFGGFFASAFKRALKIKDFGDSIPGHGGITDRFDCQIVMGMFTYFYISAFVFYNPIHPTPNSILSDLLSLSTDDQLIIFYRLLDELKSKQVLYA